MKHLKLASALAASCLAVATTAGLRATGYVQFPGVSGTENRALRDAATSGSAEVSNTSGVRLQAAEVYRDDTEILVHVVVTAPAQWGEGLSFDETTLKAADGNTSRLLQSSGTGAPGEAREVTLHFEPLRDSGALAATLNVTGFEFFTRRGDNGAITPPRNERHVVGLWSIALSLPASGPADSVSLNSTQAIAPGSAVVLERLVAGSSGLLVYGRFAGLAASDVAALDLSPRLTLDGETVPLSGGRAGYGEGGAAWEFRFDSSKSGDYPFTLTLSGKAADHPAREAVTDKQLIESFATQPRTFSWEVAVP